MNAHLVDGVCVCVCVCVCVSMDTLVYIADTFSVELSEGRCMKPSSRWKILPPPNVYSRVHSTT